MSRQKINAALVRRDGELAACVKQDAARLLEAINAARQAGLAVEIVVWGKAPDQTFDVFVSRPL